MENQFATQAKQNNFSKKLTGFKNRPPKRVIGLLVLVVLVLGIAFLVKTILNKTSVGSGQSVAGQKIQLPPAKKTKTLNKEYLFPLKDDKGQEVSKIKYVVETAELRDEIIIKGQTASSVAGRTFLIINLKLVNDFDKSIQINTKDYIRLSMNGNDSELLAPDIHNDPVEVQAISTKYTRVGFPINETDKNLKLHIGEVKGPKDIINLNF